MNVKELIVTVINSQQSAPDFKTTAKIGESYTDLEARVRLEHQFQATDDIYFVQRPANMKSACTGPVHLVAVSKPENISNQINDLVRSWAETKVELQKERDELRNTTAELTKMMGGLHMQYILFLMGEISFEIQAVLKQRISPEVLSQAELDDDSILQKFVSFPNDAPMFLAIHKKSYKQLDNDNKEVKEVTATIKDVFGSMKKFERVTKRAREDRARSAHAIRPEYADEEYVRARINELFKKRNQVTTLARFDRLLRLLKRLKGLEPDVSLADMAVVLPKVFMAEDEDDDEN